MSKVFITQETNHNFSSAEKYGELIFLTHEDMNNVRESKHNEKIFSEIKRKLRDFDPENDWIVVTGSPYVAAAAFLILGNERVQNVNILRWDNREFKYLSTFIELRREHIS